MSDSFLFNFHNSNFVGKPVHSGTIIRMLYPKIVIFFGYASNGFLTQLTVVDFFFKSEDVISTAL